MYLVCVRSGYNVTYDVGEASCMSVVHELCWAAAEGSEPWEGSNVAVTVGGTVGNATLDCRMTIANPWPVFDCSAVDVEWHRCESPVGYDSATVDVVGGVCLGSDSFIVWEPVEVAGGELCVKHGRMDAV